MALRRFTLRWWPAFVFPLILFISGWILLPYPGIQNDEVLFVNAEYAVPGSALFEAKIFHHDVPLMLLTYIGALKTWVYAPILWLCRPSYLTVRLPVLLLGVATLWFFFRLLESVHSRRAAIVGGLFLATDTVFLLTTCFDWGPVVLQHFFLVTGVLLVVKFCSSGLRLALFFGFGCFGLGMWDKALFIWILAGLVVATASVFPRDLWLRITPRSVSLAAAGFCIGALPLLAYNATSGFATFRSNSSFVFNEFRRKAEPLRNTWNGSVLFSYIANGPNVGLPREAHGMIERASYGLREAVGEHRKNRMETAFLAALLLTPLLWFTGARKKLLFCLVALGVAWFLMAITKGAGAAAHHTVLLWPVPHLFLAVAFAEASLRLRGLGGWLLALAVLYLVAGNLLVSNQYLYQLARYGGARSWSDAIYQLSEEAGRIAAPDFVVDDWGITGPLVLLHSGKLHMVFAGDQFLSPGGNDERKGWERGLLEHGVWLGHTPEFEEFVGANQRIVKTAATAGFRKELIKIVPDRNGRATFEIFRFLPN